MKVVLTGGCGFIGSTLLDLLCDDGGYQVVVVDKLTYAACHEHVAGRFAAGQAVLEQVDICDPAALHAVFQAHQPDAVIHMAAESHVDNSIRSSEAFVQTNVMGTYRLLEIVREYLATGSRPHFRFLQVSTDEVFGDLGLGEGRFTESSSYAPSSPYSATKAAADHLLMAWHRTYGLPAMITHCTNNYGPRQHLEKLIPRMIANAVAGEPLPVYGQGLQVRDWLHVADHARALKRVLEEGEEGARYNIGAGEEWRNIDVVRAVCRHVTALAPELGVRLPQAPESLIAFVDDRPGHDQRYALDASRISATLNWSPEHDFDSGLRSTVRWYLEQY